MRTIDEATVGCIPESIDAEPIGLTIIGSHVWATNHEGSDIDSMALVQEPTRKVLEGTMRMQSRSIFRSETDHDWPVDIHVHEIGRAVNYLLRGNINFIVGVMSPIVRHSTPAFEELRGIVKAFPARNVYHSLRGMTEHNIAMYSGLSRNRWPDDVVSLLRGGRLDIEPRNCKKLLNSLEYGIRHLTGDPYNFTTANVYETTTAGVADAITDLDAAYMDNPARLLDEPPEAVFRNWLYVQRIAQLARSDTKEFVGRVVEQMQRNSRINLMDGEQKIGEVNL